MAGCARTGPLYVDAADVRPSSRSRKVFEITVQEGGSVPPLHHDSSASSCGCAFLKSSRNACTIGSWLPRFCVTM